VAKMEELVSLQKEVHKIQKDIKSIKKQLKSLDSRVGVDAVQLRAEAKKVLEKASALVNPYHPNTMKYG
jgi:predicted  nucleic acid-binding Zn-ribbon protein